MTTPACPGCGRTTLTLRPNGSYFCEHEKKVFGANEVARANDPAPGSAVGTIAIATTPYIAGFRVVEMRGVAFGVSARARNMLSDLGANLKSMVGGHVGGYLKLVEAAQAEAVERLSDNARRQGGEAVISMRCEMTEIADVVQFLAYGTVVRLQADAPVSDAPPSGDFVDVLTGSEHGSR